MRKARVAASALLLLVFIQSHRITAQKPPSDGGVTKEVIALERMAPHRYQAQNPDGYWNLYAPEITYFDPMTERRIDGLKGMEEWLASVKNRKVRFKDPRHEVIRPKVSTTRMSLS